MNFDLAYLCNVHLSGTMHYDIDCICIFGINSIQLDSFNMDTNENSKNIPISHDITSKERRKFERKRERRRK